MPKVTTIDGLVAYTEALNSLSKCFEPTFLEVRYQGEMAHRASPPCCRKAGSWKALWRVPSLQPKFLPRHSPTVVCFFSLHIEKVSGIFPVALTQVAEGKKNTEFGRSKEQRSPVRIVSGAGSLKSPGRLKSGIGEGWDMFFFKAVSKCLPRPFNAAGWRCS